MIILRTVVRRATVPTSILAGVPVELHAPLLALARADDAVDDARRDVIRAAARTSLRWYQLDDIVHKRRFGCTRVI